MDRRRFTSGALVTAAVAAAMAPQSASLAAKAPENWDGLARVPSKRLKFVYLLPGADFRGYTKVMLDPTEVAFRKDWARDYNNTVRDLSGRVTPSQVEKVVEEGGKAATEIFAKAFADAGIPVVTTPGPDVLRLRTGIVNLSVSAPDQPRAGRSNTFSDEAGSAQLIVEARDSMTNALMGRGVDGRVAGDTSMLWRNRVTNRADFRTLGQSWAKACVNGFSELKKLSPVAAGGAG
jgi:hypothetical protein